jgi:IS605 OrfB family transposase
LSYELNKGKYQKIVDSVKAYCLEKDKWLLFLQKQENLHLTNSDRKIRDALIKEEYSSLFGLQARAWKQALTDACETMHRYWCAILESIRNAIYKRFNDDEQIHYAYALIKSEKNPKLYSNLSNILHGKTIELKSHKLSKAKKLEVIKYLMRKIKQARGNYPRVKLFRSCRLDSGMHSVEEKSINQRADDLHFASDYRQYASVSTLESGKRISLPLIGYEGLTKVTGKKSHFGTIRIVLIEDSKRVEIHRSVELDTQKLSDDAEVVGVDKGYTEVFATSDGILLGEGLGDISRKHSDKMKIINQRRNKLRKIRDKALKQGNYKKANNITKFNLGRKKYNKLKRKHDITAERLINQAINELVSKGDVHVAVEDLTHQFAFKRSRNSNRRMSAWLKGVIRDRLNFKSQSLGFKLTEVNAAYTSQSCPVCSNTRSDNRKGDKFKCLDCGYENQSDIVGAINIKNRVFDEEIKLKTTYQKVKELLNKRHKEFKKYLHNT